MKIIYILPLLLFTSQAYPFAEGEFAKQEHHGGVKIEPGLKRSSVHYDAVLALSRCAGFSPKESKQIANFSEAVDSEIFDDVEIHFSKRGGENSSRFHFPAVAYASAKNPLAPVLDWAIGPEDDKKKGPQKMFDPTINQLVPGCAENGSCCDIGSTKSHCVEKGTLGALGIALHSVGDYWSHKACTDNGGTGHRGTAQGGEGGGGGGRRGGQGKNAQATPAPSSTASPTTPSKTNDKESKLTAYCGAQENHTNEFAGIDLLLNENAVKGVLAIRDQIRRYRERNGLPMCKAREISESDAKEFIGKADFNGRAELAQQWYDSCSKCK